MTSLDRNNPDQVRSAAVQSTGAPAPVPRDSQWVMPREYLGDHPILVPVLSILLGGACLYTTLFSHLLRDWMLGPAPLRPDVKAFDDFMSYMIAFAFAAIFFSAIFLAVYGVEHAFRRIGRKPRACPRCRTAEEGRSRFAFTTVEGTGWDSVRCPNCGHEWYAKT
jgi:hypothetical protein